MHQPFLHSTSVTEDGFEWRPETFSDCLTELQHIQTLLPECLYYRGQRFSNRLLDSTFARKMKEQKNIKDVERYSNEQQLNKNLQHELAIKLLNTLHSVPVLNPYLTENSTFFELDGLPIDMLFQYHIHVQQNPKDPRLIQFTQLGTNFIDFSLNWKIGLFFANKNRLDSDEGALFIVHQKNLGPVLHTGKTPFQDIIRMLKNDIIQNPKKEYSGLPRLPWPKVQYNNIYDPKPKRQEAIYIAQMDFRKDLELSWKKHYLENKKQTYIKMTIPANTVNEVKEYLISQNISEEFLFPKTIFDENKFHREALNL